MEALKMPRSEHFTKFNIPETAFVSIFKPINAKHEKSICTEERKTKKYKKIQRTPNQTPNRSEPQSLVSLKV